jgi:hypothetical protein
MVADGVGELMDEEAKRGTLPSSRSEIIGWMLTSYIRAAMRQARYEIVEDDGSFYGEIPLIPGVWANAKTLEGCREELESVLEGEKGSGKRGLAEKGSA